MQHFKNCIRLHFSDPDIELLQNIQTLQCVKLLAPYYGASTHRYPITIPSNPFSTYPGELVGPLVHWSVIHTFRFPLCRCLWIRQACSSQIQYEYGNAVYSGSSQNVHRDLMWPFRHLIIVTRQHDLTIKILPTDIHTQWVVPTLIPTYIYLPTSILVHPSGAIWRLVLSVSGQSLEFFQKITQIWESIFEK